MSGDIFTNRIVGLPEDGDDRAGTLQIAAEEFLRGGGVVTVSDWFMLSEETRDALIAAGDRVRWETAGITAAAMRSEEIQRAALTGEDVDDLHVEKALEKMAAKLRGDK